MDFDPNSAATGGASVGAAAFLIAWLRKLWRTDAKEVVVDGSWVVIIAGLREEVQRYIIEGTRLYDEIVRLREDVAKLTLKVNDCESDREKLQGMITSFERRYGMRTEGNAE